MYRKIYHTKTEYRIEVLENGYYKNVPDKEQSLKVQKWLNAGNKFEVVEWKEPDLNELKLQLLEQAKSEVSSKLQETDYIVLRQFERKEAKKATKLLTETEFIAFSDGRQALRDKLNTYETAINNANTYDEIMGVKYGE